MVRPDGTSTRTALKLRNETAKFIRHLGGSDYLDMYPRNTILISYRVIFIFSVLEARFALPLRCFACGGLCLLIWVCLPVLHHENFHFFPLFAWLGISASSHAALGFFSFSALSFRWQSFP